ncbi:hypothetical protein OLX02_11130 [Novosphingobium sp. KCTC 2891]|uniref:hypothetical protein n=1 Tax=Novosphingobium sp. KCTC 2891 TaxID=2989730 RepID=UPI002222B7A9|nr:hypothetical protein [Novosphingobium sp. KCTC 2891]MCW1383374.1 hypothetical protein [Novosphingobium sp. KCTC 2891]
MNLRPLLPSLAMIVALAATPAAAVPGGQLGTMTVGRWVCELPGDAALPATPVTDEDFWIVQDSSYRLRSGEQGSYLLLGNMLTMTSGPKNGHRYRLDSSAMVHRLGADGQQQDLRCVKSGTPSVYVEPAPQPASQPGPAATPQG